MRLKNIFKQLMIIALLIFSGFTIINAQNIPPQGFNYQAVARETNGNLLINQNLIVRISILNSNPTLIWQESHSVVTNDYGLFTLVIGAGVTTGFGTASSFSGIDWSVNEYFVKVEVDFYNGLYGLLDMGTTKFQSVPYALYSDSVRVAPKFQLRELTDVDVTGIFPNQILKWNGTQWIPSLATANPYNAGNGIIIFVDTIYLDTIVGGDLDGFYPNPIVDGILGFPINSAGLNVDKILMFDGIQWIFVDDSVGGGGTYTGGSYIFIDTIANVIHLDTTMTGGDLDGFYPSPFVVGILGFQIDPSGLGMDKILMFDGAQWVFVDDSAGSSYTGGSYIIIDTIANVIHLDTTMTGGDLDGFYPSPFVTGIMGFPIDPSGFGMNKILMFDGVQWVFVDDSAGSSYTGGSYIIIDTTANVIHLDTTMMGGDVAGFYPSPMVVGIQGNMVSSTAPVMGDVLFWDVLNNQWTPAGPGGDISGLYNSMLVTKIRGRDISSVAPIQGQVLMWDFISNSWNPTTPTGGGSNQLIDNDSDTKVEVEATPDEDKIRFTTNSIERMIIDDVGNIGVNTSTPNSTFEINGSEAKKVTISNSLALDETHNVVLVNNTFGFATISLPAASTCNGRVYTIKRINSGSVSINPNGLDNIDGSTATLSLAAQWDFITVISDGSDWFIIGTN